MADIPYLTAEQMRDVDRLMVEEYRIELLQMMENAGRHLAHLARERFLDGDPRGRSVLVLAGAGGNGGGGLAAARRLQSWGATVRTLLARPPADYGGVPAHQLAILRRQGMFVSFEPVLEALPAAELILDALIGYSLEGEPRGAAATLIRGANAHEAPVISLDVPSGIEATTGRVGTPAIRADATLTLALPKSGLSEAGGRDHAGELYLADIGVPPELYADPALGLEVGPLFAREEILRIGPQVEV